jgi:MtrB/PioB family decaheme-associated outer membrane protein
MMKTIQVNLSLSVLALAVQSALAAMVMTPLAAMADDTVTAADQTNPTNTIEIGGVYTSKDSAKFGEYNGLNKKGTDLNANLSLKGGDAYGQGAGTNYWSVTGTDLGTTSRELGATMGNQGKWKLGIDYDELQHNIDDTYKTPYNGTMGGNLFSLPATFDSTTATTGLSQGQLDSFHQQDVYSKRENASLKAGINLDRQWSLDFDYKHIDQSGAKLIGSGSDAIVDGAGEYVSILLNPTNSKTDNFNLALNWKGDKGFASIGYYGSLYHDEVNGLSWSDPWGGGTSPYQTNSMATPPSNQFHQLNLTGGYHLSPVTQLVGGLSYARNTQNASYAGTYTDGAATAPVGSLDASVIMKHADLKLTNQTTKSLNLSAGFTYNERDNHTASNTYTFTTLSNITGLTPINVPESWKHTQFDLAGDYRIDGRQRVHAGYNYDNFQRWCDTPPATFYTWNTGTSAMDPNTANTCAQVPKQTTNGLALDYRLTASDALSFKAGYAYSKRKSDVNANFYNPLHSISDGYENTGFLAFFQASRNENAVKLSTDWQATEKLNISLSGKYTKDDYTDSTYGVQQGDEASINLDGAYTISENFSVNAFVTSQHRTRDLSNVAGEQYNGMVAGGIYTNNLTDDDLMLGIGSKQKGLMGGKLELSEDLSYSLGKTDYSTGAGGTLTCDPTLPTCGAFPTIKSGITTLKLSGKYQISKPAKVVVSYQYQHLSTNDPYYYAGYQYGYDPTILPTYQQAPSYNVSTLFVAYAYSFK